MKTLIVVILAVVVISLALVIVGGAYALATAFREIEDKPRKGRAYRCPCCGRLRRFEPSVN